MGTLTGITINYRDKLTNSEIRTGYSCEVIFTKNLGNYRYYQMLVLSSNDTSYYSLAIEELELSVRNIASAPSKDNN